MNRKTFLKSLAVIPLAAGAMKLTELDKITEPFGTTEKIARFVFRAWQPDECD